MEHALLLPRQTPDAVQMQEAKIPTPRAALEELFVLLEDYAPTWYTVDHHNRALAALLMRESR